MTKRNGLINTQPFLSEGKEMGKLIRKTDWEKTDLGDPGLWPGHLRDAVRTMLDVPYGMCIAWSGDYIQLYNDAYAKWLSVMGLQEGIGKSLQNTFGELWSSVSPLVSKASKGHIITSSDVVKQPLHNAETDSFLYTLTLIPIKDDSGKVDGIIITAVQTLYQWKVPQEVNESQTELQAFKASEERFRTLAKSSVILIALSDSSSNATYFNKAWSELTGRPIEELLKFGWTNLIHPEDKDRFVNHYLDSFKKRVAFNSEFRILNSVGEYRWLLTKGPPLFAPDGTFHGYISSSIDITEQKKTFAEIEESEGELRNMVITAPIGICVIDGLTRVCQIVNDSFIEVAGKSREEILGKNYWESFAEAAPYYEQALTSVIEKGITFYANEVELMLIRHGKKELIFVTFVYSPLKDKDGKVKQVAVWVLENTSQVVARQRVEQTEQEVRSLVEAAPFPIGVYRGREMRVTLANKSILDVWGKGNNVIGKLFSEILPELENQEVFRQLDEVYKTGVAFHIKNQRLDLIVDGKERVYYFNYNLTPLFDASGKIYGVMNTGVDLTELILARKKLEESEKNLRNMVLQAPVAMCILLGSDHVVEVANDLIIDLWGKPKEDVLNKPIFVALPDAKGQGLEKVMADVYETGKNFTANEMPVNLLRKGKTDTVYQNFVYEPYRDSDGTILGVLAITIDVTAQVLARQQIEQVVAKRTEELEEANRSLKKSNADLAQFAYIASHDLQEPLRKIGTFSDMMRRSLEDRLDERSKAYLEKINNSASRMNTLIRNVLSYSELDRVNEGFVTVDLNKIVSDVRVDYDLLIEQKNATVYFENLPTIRAIPLQMSQLFANLLGNALKFVKEDITPEIKIWVEELSAIELEQHSLLDQGLRYHKIILKDNGIGLKPEFTDQIFDIFQRLHRKSEFEGTGIGLALCKKITLNHNGDINAKGSSESGAVFNIILPASK